MKVGSCIDDVHTMKFGKVISMSSRVPTSPVSNAEEIEKAVFFEIFGGVFGANR